MEKFNVVSFLIGLLKGIPAVGLSLMTAWRLVKTDFALDARGVDRIMRYVALCAISFVVLWAISVLCYTTYDGELHPVVVVIMTPFILIGYIQIIWYELKKRGIRVGNPDVNKRWLIAYFVIELISLGLYPLETGVVAHTILSVILLMVYIGVLQFLVWWTYGDRFGLPKKKGWKEEGGEFVVVILLILLAWYGYKVIENWPGWVIQIPKYR